MKIIAFLAIILGTTKLFLLTHTSSEELSDRMEKTEVFNATTIAKIVYSVLILDSIISIALGIFVFFS